MREFRIRGTGSESYDVSPKRYIEESDDILAQKCLYLLNIIKSK